MPQGGNLPFGLAPSGSLTSYTPTLRDRATDWMRRKLFSDDRAGQGRAEKVMDVASFTPFGFGLDMYDAGREAGQGNLGAAGATLAMSFAPGPSPKKIRAFHGSPHDFDRFDMSKIGTGEGAQAYGHGLYFAENEGVAKGYKTNLSYKHLRDRFLEELPQDADFSEVEELMAQGYFTPDQTRLLAELRNNDWLGFDYPSQAITAATRGKLGNYDPTPELEDAADKIGKMYEVNINADPDTFLDWDKPLSEQPEAVLNAISDIPEYQAWLNHRVSDEDVLRAAAIKKYGYDPLGSKVVDAYKNPTGSGLYKQLSTIKSDSVSQSGSGDTQTAAELLKGAGIPGIKYLDAGSRGAGDGTRNYVVFDDRLIEIVRKYGIAGASAILGYNLLDGMDPAQAEELKRIEGNQ